MLRSSRDSAKPPMRINTSSIIPHCASPLAAYSWALDDLLLSTRKLPFAKGSLGLTVAAHRCLGGQQPRHAGKIDPLGLVGRGDGTRRTSVDLPPVIGELTLNDRGKTVSIEIGRAHV